MNIEDLKRVVSSTFDFDFSLFFLTTNKILKRPDIKVLFDQKVTGYPLTKRQKLSVLLDEKRNLVIAGAGTGKTTTIIGKILYLLNEKKCKEEEILVMAFSKAAEGELKERLKSHNVINVKIKTFHALGLEIIRKIYGKEPRITRLQGKALIDFINRKIEKSEDPDLNKKLAQYFKKYMIPYSDDIEKSEQDYLRWKNTTQLKTLNGNYVKSYGEYAISNYLFANGFQHSYEEKYPNRSYWPDFHISNSNTYIEYFGIDKNGKTAPWIPRKKYIDGMQWKKELHRENGTNLIEITYADIKDDTWENKLKKQLENFGYRLSPLSDKEIIKAKVKNSTSNDAKFSKLIQNFLVLYKSKFKDDFEILNSLISDHHKKKDIRTLTFLNIFKNIFTEYQNYLKQNDEIDFSDMINRSTNFIKRDQFLCKWKYIIVDEFQDTSFAQSEFIVNILKQNENTKLYAVGDDWQSIFCFNGADYHMMTDFKKHFGADPRFLKSVATYIELDETFRFDSSISENTKKFILKNKTQISKKLKPASNRIINKTSIFINWAPSSLKEAIKLWLAKHANEQKYRGKNLLILSRYNFQFEDLPIEFINEIQNRWSVNGDVNFLSCHKSKGTEQDVILIIGLSSDNLGFPSNIEDDPILKIVLTDPDEYPFAEERRVLYVAMTRAKFETHLLCDFFNKSSFAEELSNKKEFKIEHLNLVTDFNSFACPKCYHKGGVILNRTKTKGKKNFYKCNREPICDYVGSNCKKCDSLMIKDTKQQKTNAVCSNKSCTNQDPFCDRCKIGVMNRVPPFDESKLGCSLYPACKNIIEKL